jgi:hypothetical protein
MRIAKVLTGLVLFLLPGVTLAECRVYIPEKEFLHSSGYAIQFDFESILTPRGYVEVIDPSTSDLVLTVSGQEVEGRFHRARAEMRFGSLQITEEKICFTQWCGIQDYASAFRKAYRSLGRRISNCR